MHFLSSAIQRPSARPLCRRHWIVALQRICIELQGESAATKVCWGIGFHREGGCEILGVWLETYEERSAPELVLSDLVCRGLERSNWVAGPELDLHLTACVASGLGAGVLSDTGTASSAICAAASINQRVQGRMAQQRCITGLTSALDFIESMLLSEERRINALAFDDSAARSFRALGSLRLQRNQSHPRLSKSGVARGEL